MEKIVRRQIFANWGIGIYFCSAWSFITLRPRNFHYERLKDEPPTKKLAKNETHDCWKSGLSGSLAFIVWSAFWANVLRHSVPNVPEELLHLSNLPLQIPSHLRLDTGDITIPLSYVINTTITAVIILISIAIYLVFLKIFYWRSFSISLDVAITKTYVISLFYLLYAACEFSLAIFIFLYIGEEQLQIAHPPDELSWLMLNIPPVVIVWMLLFLAVYIYYQIADDSFIIGRRAYAIPAFYVVLSIAAVTIEAWPLLSSMTREKGEFDEMMSSHHSHMVSLAYCEEKMVRELEERGSFAVLKEIAECGCLENFDIPDAYYHLALSQQRKDNVLEEYFSTYSDRNLLRIIKDYYVWGRDCVTGKPYPGPEIQALLAEGKKGEKDQLARAKEREAAGDKGWIPMGVVVPSFADGLEGVLRDQVNIAIDMEHYARARYLLNYCDEQPREDQESDLYLLLIYQRAKLLFAVQDYHRAAEVLRGGIRVSDPDSSWNSQFTLDLAYALYFLKDQELLQVARKRLSRYGLVSFIHPISQDVAENYALIAAGEYEYGTADVACKVWRRLQKVRTQFDVGLRFAELWSGLEGILDDKTCHRSQPDIVVD